MPRLSKKNKDFLLVGGFGLTLFGVLYMTRHKIKSFVTGEASPKNNQEYLNTLHPKYKGLFTLFVNRVTSKGYKVQINSAYRSFAKQAQLKKEDPRNATAGFSVHNYGLGIDMQVSKDGKIYGKDTPTSEWLKTGIPQLAQSMGLFWGDNFKGYHDRVHFEVAGMNTGNLYASALRQFQTTDPNKIQGNRVNIA
jgi:hypothetical protein